MFTRIPKSVSVTDLRKDMSKYVKESAKEPVVISVGRGKEARVLMNADDYNQILDERESNVKALWQQASAGDILNDLGEISKEETDYYAKI